MYVPVFGVISCQNYFLIFFVHNFPHVEGLLKIVTHETVLSSREAGKSITSKCGLDFWFNLEVIASLLIILALMDEKW